MSAVLKSEFFETKEGAENFCRKNPGFVASRRVRGKGKQWAAVPKAVALARPVSQLLPAPRISRKIGALMREPTAPRWLHEDELERGVIAIAVGARGSFKTTVVTHWGMRAAVAGEPVLWLCAEGGNADRLAEAWLKKHAPNIDPDTLPLHVVQRRYDLSGEGLPIIRAECEAIRAEHGRVALVIGDTVSKLSSFKENDNTEARLFISRLDSEIRAVFDATILLVGHTGHGDQSRARGASAFAADTEAEYIISRAPCGLVKVTRERFKATPELPPLVLQTEVIDLGRRDEKGRPVTAVTIAGETSAPAALRSLKKPGNVSEDQSTAAKVAAEFLMRSGNKPVAIGDAITEALRRKAKRNDELAPEKFDKNSIRNMRRSFESAARNVGGFEFDPDIDQFIHAPGRPVLLDEKGAPDPFNI